jgi:hypothetical protein
MKPSISARRFAPVSSRIAEQLGIPDVEYLAERSTAVNTNLSGSQYYPLFMICLLS